MAVYFTSLNSGSNGNCYYIGNNTEAVLVDAGLSCKETERRMLAVGLDIKMVKAIFVSHEHIDHVRGLAGLADKYNLPIYVNEATQKGCYHVHSKHVITLTENKSINIGALVIRAFKKYHDAADPYSFTITHIGITIGVFTDIGRPCDKLIKHFKKCQAAFLEANYDKEMLANGRYPQFLQNRISGGLGHLSNDEALNIFINHKHKKMRYLLLAHLSKDNNCPKLVETMFTNIAGATKILVASRYEAMPVMRIKKDEVSIKSLLKKENAVVQLNIF